MIASFASTQDYCRRARRVRALHCDDIGLKLASLRALSNQHDRALHAGAQRSAAPDPLRDPVREFSDRVSCELTGTSILRYSRRVALLNRARRLGIDRFDANLLIAEVQDRNSSMPGNMVVLPGRRWLYPACVVVIVQSCVVGAAKLLLG